MGPSWGATAFILLLCYGDNSEVMIHHDDRHATKRWWYGLRTGTIGLLVGLILVLGGCGTDQSSDSETNLEPRTAGADTMTIDHVLRTDDRFSTFAAAMDSTELDSTLRGEGPYTLFAPPNAAFDALPEGTLPILLNERPEQLYAIVAQHIVPERAPLANQSGAWQLPTLDGDSLRLIATDTSVTLRNARVVDGDIETANGLIHVIDRVLRPSADEEGREDGGP